MHCRVLPLRRKGARLPHDPDRLHELPTGVLRVGRLEWGTPPYTDGAACLTLMSAFNAYVSPLLKLYEPRVTDVGHRYFKLRGYEPDRDGERWVGYLQEWAVFPAEGTASEKSSAISEPSSSASTPSSYAAAR